MSLAPKVFALPCCLVQVVLLVLLLAVLRVGRDQCVCVGRAKGISQSLIAGRMKTFRILP